MRKIVACGMITFASLAAAWPCTAQRAPQRFATSPVPALRVINDTATRSGSAAFLIEAAGGIAGSLAGFGLIYSTDSGCGSEDLVCNLRQAGAAVLVGTIGAASGAYIAGRLADTEPSALGIIIGAIAGAGAGLGAAHLVTEELNWVNSDAGAIITFSVAQGVTTALGSRIVRALK